MSWLSQGLSDIGLGGVNKFFDTAVKPALENPYVDVGLGLAGGALLGPAIGGLFGAGADAAGAGGGGLIDLSGAGAAAGGDTISGLGATTDLASAAGASGDALALGGDVSSVDPSLQGFLANPGLAAGGGGTSALPADASALTGTAGGTSVPLTAGGTIDPSLASAAAPGATDDLTTLSSSAYGAATPSAATTAISGTAGAPAQGGFLSSLQSQFNPSTLGAATGKALTSPASLLGAGGLAYNLYQGYQQKQQLNALNQQEAQNAATIAQNASTAQQAAGPALSQGQLLTQYLTSGTLPQALQSQVDQQVAATKAQIIQGYGARGMSTNPQQNSALAQDLANVDAQKETTMGSLQENLAQAGQQMITTATNLLNSGTSATNIAANIPIMMQNLDIQLSKLTSQSIASFAAALNGGNRTGTGTGQVTLNVGTG